MKTIKLIIFVTFIGVLTQSCHKREFWGIRGKGESITETRNIKGFSAISLSGSPDVTYTQDSVYKVEVTGQENILDLLVTEVEGSELKIYFRKNIWEHRSVKLVIHSPQMNGMKVSGSGNIRSSKGINTGSMNLRVSGSGNISLPSLVASGLDVTISGSGNTDVLGGKVNTAHFVVSGSGNINAEHIESVGCTAKVSGSGNIRLHATETLNVTISGSGDVRYKGSPAIDVNISGSGKLRRI